MNSFKTIFAQRSAFIAYITAGHRGLDYTEQAVLALIAGGVDIVEIGVPFSDPVADGPTIQHAMSDALNHSVNLAAVLNTIKNIKQKTIAPIVLFTYYNPLYKAGVNNLLQQARAAGVDGLLVVDLPLEESTDYFAQCQLNNIEPICLITPSTDTARIKKINTHCDSFLYYVCRHGTTGVQQDLPENYAEKMPAIKSISANPVVSGFGIGNRALAAQALTYADGFVVGSAFVQAVTAGASPADLTALAREIDPR